MHLLPTVLVIAGVAAALAVAPMATASPECTNTGPTTTLCQSPGHSQIVTSPPVINNGYLNGFPFGGFGFVIDPF